MKERKRKKKSALVTVLYPIIMAVIIVYLAWSLISNQVQIGAKQQQLTAVQLQIEAQRLENEELSRQLESDDEELMEQAARDELGYAKPNERVFVDISGK